MMKLENSSFHSIAETTLPKSTKYVIRTQVELVDVSWKERSKLTQLLEDTIMRRTSSSEKSYILSVSNSCFQRLMSTLKDTWRIMVTYSHKLQLKVLLRK